MHVFNGQEFFRTIAKHDFPFINNSLLEQCQNNKYKKCDRYGFIEVIEVGEILFDLLKAFLVSTCILSLLLQVFKIVFQSLYSFLKLR